MVSPADPRGRWAVGDGYGLRFPADPAALRDAGVRFLSEAFRASGALRDNGIRRIARLREVDGGSTGRKAVLSVEYDRPQPELHTELFVKFSRDFDNPVRDVGRTQMEPEVRFAALSRTPDFPIAVPRVHFADYHRASGTGILITERIRFGENGIERQYHKCLDDEMPDQLGHYRALLAALARLAGAHRAGRLPPHLTAHFPVDIEAATVGVPRSTDQLGRRVAELVGFIGARPTLMPGAVGAPEFLARFTVEAPRVAADEGVVLRHLAADGDYVALCHWNANVDNAWFWRGADGLLRCGLMDWGCVGQMNLGMAMWGALSGADTTLLDRHLDELLGVFAAEIRRSGGPDLDPDRLLGHMLLYAATMGVRWLLDVPALLRKRFGTAVPESPRDPRIRDDESVRAPLQMLSNLLWLWDRYRVGDVLDAALGESAAL